MYHALGFKPITSTIIETLNDSQYSDYYTAVAALPQDFTSLPYRGKPNLLSATVTSGMDVDTSTAQYVVQFFLYSEDYSEGEQLSYSVFNEILLWQEREKDGASIFQRLNVNQIPIQLADDTRRYAYRFSFVITFFTSRYFTG